LRPEADPCRHGSGRDERVADAIIEKLGAEVAMSARSKVTVVGAGNVGATCAQVLATRDYADVVLVDIIENLPQGKALDINQMGWVLGYEPNVVGTNGYEETAGSSVVVITAGKPRSPGMSRDDLVTTNESIVGSVTEQVVAQSPDAILVVVSNPLDAMCHVAKNVSGFEKERVFGQAGILDTARLKTFIAWETGSSVKDVQAVVLGGHGDQMVPVISATTVGGVPVRRLVSEDRIQAMVERTAKGGGEIVNLLGTSAWYAPGAAAAQMVDSIVLDQKRVLPCTAYLEGEYGIDGLYMGVPVKLGAGGIEEIVELDLTEDEEAALQASAAAVSEVVGVLTT
jgi:malate dehydrogenase